MTATVIDHRAPGLREPGEAHVWTADPALMTRAEEAELAQWVLCEQERVRMRRFHFARDRRLFVAAHALLRSALSACAPTITPAGWSFVTTQHGRPELASPRDGLRFNLSHAHGLVACVVTRDVDCGVDVERTDRRDVTQLSASVLGPSEQRTLAALPGSAAPARFFRYWTLKEAYVKARGLGLSLELKRCVLALDGTRPLLLDAPGDPRPEDWQFAEFAPTPGHALAVALHAPAGPLRIVCHTGPPSWYSVCAA